MVGRAWSAGLTLRARCFRLGLCSGPPEAGLDLLKRHRTGCSGASKTAGFNGAAVYFKVLPNLSVLAGADLPPDKLVPLFRHCKIKRIDRVFEFQLDKRQLAETPIARARGLGTCAKRWKERGLCPRRSTAC